MQQAQQLNRAQFEQQKNVPALVQYGAEEIQRQHDQTQLLLQAEAQLMSQPIVQNGPPAQLALTAPAAVGGVAHGNPATKAAFGEDYEEGNELWKVERKTLNQAVDRAKQLAEEAGNEVAAVEEELTKIYGLEAQIHEAIDSASSEPILKGAQALADAVVRGRASLDTVSNSVMEKAYSIGSWDTRNSTKVGPLVSAEFSPLFSRLAVCRRSAAKLGTAAQFAREAIKSVDTAASKAQPGGLRPRQKPPELLNKPASADHSMTESEHVGDESHAYTSGDADERHEERTGAHEAAQDEFENDDEPMSDNTGPPPLPKPPAFPPPPTSTPPIGARPAPDILQGSKSRPSAPRPLSDAAKAGPKPPSSPAPAGLLKPSGPPKNSIAKARMAQGGKANSPAKAVAVVIKPRPAKVGAALLPGLSASSGVADPEREQTGVLKQCVSKAASIASSQTDGNAQEEAPEEMSSALAADSESTPAPAVSKAECGPPPALKKAGAKANNPAMKAKGMLTRKRKVDDVL